MVRAAGVDGQAVGQCGAGGCVARGIGHGFEFVKNLPNLYQNPMGISVFSGHAIEPAREGAQHSSLIDPWHLFQMTDACADQT